MGWIGRLFGGSSKSRKHRADAVSFDEDRADATHRLAGVPMVEDAGDPNSEAERPFDEGEASEDLRAHADTVRHMVKGPGLGVSPGGGLRSTGTAASVLAPSSFGRGAPDRGIRPRGEQPGQGAVSDVGPQGLSAGALPALDAARQGAMKAKVFQPSKLDWGTQQKPSVLPGARFGQQAQRHMNPRRDGNSDLSALVARGKGKFAPIRESKDEDAGVNPYTGFDADAYEDQIERKVRRQRRFNRGEISAQEFDRFMGTDLPEELTREKPFDAGSTLEMGEVPAPRRRPARELPVPDRSPGLSQMWDSMEARSRAEAGARSREKLDYSLDGPRTRNFTTDDVSTEAAPLGDRPTRMITGPEALGQFVAGRKHFQGAGTAERPHQVRLDDTRYRYRRDADSDSREVAKPQALLDWERGAGARAAEEEQVQGAIQASDARAKHLSRGNRFTSFFRKLWNRKSIKKSKSDSAAAQQRLAGMRSQWEATDRSLNRSETAPREVVDPASPLAPGYAAGMAADIKGGKTAQYREAEDAPAVRAELDPFYDYAQARSEDILASKGNLIADPRSDYRDPRQVFPDPDEPKWGKGNWRDYSEWEGEETSVEEGLRRADVKKMYSRANFDKEHEQWRGQMDATIKKRLEYDKEQRRDHRPSPTLADIYARQEQSYGDVAYGSEQVDRHDRRGGEKEALRRAAKKLKSGMAPTSEDSDQQLTSKAAEAQRQQGLIAAREDDVFTYPKAKAALGAVADANSGEITRRREASDLEIAKEAQKQEGRAAFWGPIEQQRAEKQRQQEEARRAAEEAARKEIEDQQRREALRSMIASLGAEDARVPRAAREAPESQQNGEADTKGESIHERMARKKAAKDARNLEEQRRMAPLLAQMKAQDPTAYEEYERRARVAAAEGETSTVFDPSGLSIRDRFDPDSPDLVAEIDALERQATADRAARAQESEARRLAAAAEAGGARSSVINRGLSVTEDYTSRVGDREREWLGKLHEELPYTQTEEGLKDRARHAEITGPEYYQGLDAFQRFQDEKGTAERWKRGTVAFDYEGGREMTPEERLDAAWQSTTTMIDNESARRKRNARATMAGKAKGLITDKNKVTPNLLARTMSDIDAPESRSKEVKEVLKSYMEARRGGVDKGLIRRPGAKKSIAPSALPGADPERLETFLRERGVLGKKQPATPDLLDAYSMSASDFARKRMGQMWTSPVEESREEEAPDQEPEEMMPSSRPRQRIMNQELPDVGSGLARLQEQAQESQVVPPMFSSSEAYDTYRKRQQDRDELEKSIVRPAGDSVKAHHAAPVMPSAPVTKEEYLAREAREKADREAEAKFAQTKEGQKLKKEREEHIKAMGLSTGEKLKAGVDNVASKLGVGGDRRRNLKPSGGADGAEDSKVFREDLLAIRAHNATAKNADVMVREPSPLESAQNRTVQQRPQGMNLMTSYLGEYGAGQVNPMAAPANTQVSNPMANDMIRVEEGEAPQGRLNPMLIDDHLRPNLSAPDQESVQAQAPSQVPGQLASAIAQQPKSLGGRLLNAIGLGASGSQQAPAQQAPQPAVIRPEHRLAAERAANGRQQAAGADRAKFLEETARTIAEREAAKLREPGFKAPNAVDPDRELAKGGPGLMERLESGMDQMGADIESGMLGGIGQAGIPLVSMAANAQNAMNASSRAASAKEQAKAKAQQEKEQRALIEELRRKQAQGLMKQIASGAKNPEMMGDLYAASSQRKAQGRAGLQDKLLADYDQYQKLRSDYKAGAHKRAVGEYANETIERKVLKDGDLLKEMLVPDFDVSESLNDIMAGEKIKHGYFRVPRKK